MRQLGARLAFGLLAFGLGLVPLALHEGAGLRYVVLARPWFLLLALLPLAALLWRSRPALRPAALRFSRVSSLRALPRSWALRLAELPVGLRLAACLLVVLALGRPQSTRGTERVEHEGIDIAIALDLSESMEAPDLYPTRLDAAKVVIDDFVQRRSRDRIALVAFGANASTVAPLTMDHGILRSLIGRLRLGVMDGSNTAIGAGIGMALNRLAESEASSKIIVLLTDGVHNAAGIDPDTVAQEAAERGVKVFTVLMGRHQGAGATAVDPAQLERIAGATGGYAYTAADAVALQTSFQDLLDRLERSEIEGETIRAELFFWLLWSALALLFAEQVLLSTRLRSFP